MSNSNFDCVFASVLMPFIHIYLQCYEHFVIFNFITKILIYKSGVRVYLRKYLKHSSTVSGSQSVISSKD